MQAVWHEGFHLQLIETGRGSTVSSCCTVLYERQSCASYCNPIEDQVNSFRGLSWKSIAVQYSVIDCLDLLMLFTLCRIVSKAVIILQLLHICLGWNGNDWASILVQLQLTCCCYCKGFWISFIILLLHSIDFSLASCPPKCFQCLFFFSPLTYILKLL